MYLQADEAVKFEDGCFDRIKAAMPGDAPMSDGSKPGGPNADVTPEQQNAEQDWSLQFIFDVSAIPFTKPTNQSSRSPSDVACLQNKLHLKRYLDSLLRLSTKLKGLRREMKDQYTPESTAESKPY